ncbi:CheR family methyltransferase [Roseateles sp. NT4]|uniref:CheR family methyltransferase n=1 Tax=Roseateles sp. NT4 TaxID=3453715 RepID=UPI003EEE8A7F
MTWPVLQQSAYEQLAALMEASLGLSLSMARKAGVALRLAPRLQRLGLDSYEAYVAFIGSADGATEFQIALDLLTTLESHFFREPQHFDLLESELSRLRPQRLRLWSAATAFGDEAYSLAMLLSDLQQAGRIGADWSVLGSDVSERALRGAVEALYSEDRLRHVTPERMRRYGLRASAGSVGLVQMQAALRERVEFLRLDLRRPVDELGPFDAILLRHVLPYFDARTAQALVERLLERLRPGGLFFTGASEAFGHLSLEPLAPGAFRRK